MPTAFAFAFAFVAVVVVCTSRKSSHTKFAIRFLLEPFNARITLPPLLLMVAAAAADYSTIFIER